MISRAFHVNIHRQPLGMVDGGPIMFPRTFEHVTDSLARLPRMFIEPDGSFVWVASHEPPWQVDGVLYDGTKGLWYAEVKGSCPEPQFDELLRTLGWPKTPVVFQLVEEAMELHEDGFRRYAGWVD